MEMQELPSNFNQIEVDGVRVGYIKHDLMGSRTVKRYEIAIEIDGEFKRLNKVCEEIIFMDVLKEIVFLAKLQSRK